MSQNGDERERHLTKLRAIFADFVRLVNAFSRGGRPRLLFGANAPRFDIFTPDALFWLAEVPPGEDPATVIESMRTPRLQLQGLPMSADPPSDSSPETTTPSAPPPSSSQPASTTTTSTLLMTSRASSARSGGRDAAPHPPSPATSCAAHPFLSSRAASTSSRRPVNNRTWSCKTSRVVKRRTRRYRVRVFCSPRRVPRGK